MEEPRMNTEEYIKVMKESPERKRGYIFAAVTLVISVLLIILAIRPTILTITRINGEIKEKTRLNTLLDSKINSLSALDKEYTEYKDDFDSLKLIFPDDGDFGLLMANITGVVAKDGFTMTSINFDKYGGKDFTLTTSVLVPWSLRMNVKGQPANLSNMLKDLEALPMYPVIESLSYSSQKDENGLTVYSIALRIYKIDNSNFY